MIESYLLEELSVFAQTGTLTKTATQLNVTQPSVTRGMQNWKTSLGFSYLSARPIIFSLPPQAFLQLKKLQNY